MNLSVRISRIFAMLTLCVLGGAAVTATARAQEAHPRVPKSVRLYVFDCGVIKGLDPALFNFKREEVKTIDFAVPCYLIVDPKGTLIWDVGVIRDAGVQGRRQARDAGALDRDAHIEIAAGGDRLRARRHHVSRALALSRRPHRQFQRICGVDVARPAH